MLNTTDCCGAAPRAAQRLLASQSVGHNETGGSTVAAVPMPVTANVSAAGHARVHFDAGLAPPHTLVTQHTILLL
jgi:hypothetical protein